MEVIKDICAITVGIEIIIGIVAYGVFVRGWNLFL